MRQWTIAIGLDVYRTWMRSSPTSSTTAGGIGRRRVPMANKHGVCEEFVARVEALGKAKGKRNLLRLDLLKAAAKYLLKEATWGDDKYYYNYATEAKGTVPPEVYRSLHPALETVLLPLSDARLEMDEDNGNIILSKMEKNRGTRWELELTPVSTSELAAALQRQAERLEATKAAAA